MSAFVAIDLSQLPAPTVVEPLDYETVLAAIKADLIARDPTLEPVLAVESEPVTKLCEVVALRELLLRQRVNDGARACMLAYATGADLDHLAALFGVQRQVVDPGDPNAVPPVPPTYESDDRLRARTQLALEGYTTAGSVGAYVFYALSASTQVKDVSVTSPNPGEVLVSVLSTVGDGTPDPALLDTVRAALNAEDVRPLTDQVTVQAPTRIITYSVSATLTLYPGPDAATVEAAAQQAVNTYVTDHHRLGHDITRSGLIAALHQPGVQRVALSTPAADIVATDTEAAYCTGVTVTVGGTGV